MFIPGHRIPAQHDPASATDKYGRSAADSGPHITLWSAGSDHDTWAICGDEGQLIAFGPFGFDDPDHPQGDPLRADNSAAIKAIRLAARAREAINAPAATVHLMVSRTLDNARLTNLANSHQLVLDLIVTSDWNPATEWVNSGGYLQPAVDPVELLSDDAYPTAS
ncbi:hypothetical protein OG874_35760 [Nocardia sp. NBC_00565]|uniref:hypothetical protein n=1 Tax=Nocardia sp. NBC_00565 TaxID=2975993 RepID=UPI002E811CF6|nr:hypothetical protein [Nocardia sp. NBC_00565]WUC02048.1 hypothetical protein OG874_35760 [Nocardia sp. NBC_00565]